MALLGLGLLVPSEASAQSRSGGDFPSWERESDSDDRPPLPTVRGGSHRLSLSVPLPEGAGVMWKGNSSKNMQKGKVRGNQADPNQGAAEGGSGVDLRQGPTGAGSDGGQGANRGQAASPDSSQGASDGY